MSSVKSFQTVCTLQILNLPMLRLLPSKSKDGKMFEKHLNPVMLVFIG